MIADKINVLFANKIIITNKVYVFNNAQETII